MFPDMNFQHMCTSLYAWWLDLGCVQLSLSNCTIMAGLHALNAQANFCRKHHRTVMYYCCKVTGLACSKSMYAGKLETHATDSHTKDRHSVHAWRMYSNTSTLFVIMHTVSTTALTACNMLGCISHEMQHLIRMTCHKSFSAGLVRLSHI